MEQGKTRWSESAFKLKEIWAIRVRLQIASRCRELALINLAVDSKLRACDFVQLRVRDVCHGQSMASRALILPHNVYSHARSLLGLKEYYSDMNDDRIEIMFQIGDTATFIDYAPASWPKPDTTHTTSETAIGGPSASSN